MRAGGGGLSRHQKEAARKTKAELKRLKRLERRQQKKSLVSAIVAHVIRKEQ
jgi:hypothetical protein